MPLRVVDAKPPFNLVLLPTMNEAILTHHDDAVKPISDPFDRSTIDEENERLYAEADLGIFRVPVTLIRKGVVTVRARDAKVAESIAKVMAAFADDIDNSVRIENVGPAVAI